MSFPVFAVIGAARSLRFVREEPKNTNRGQAVRAFLKLVGLKEGEAWCAAFVAWVGSSVFGAARWPLPLTGGCLELGAAAERAGILVSTPEVGDVFLSYRPKKGRFGHTGFIVGEKNAAGGWPTIEGNTGENGTDEGWGVFERVRVFGPEDRFIRWTKALKGAP